jgi:subfamily B ATP-binding cassette protein MsbA
LKLPRFFWKYLRHYVGWALIALLAVPLYGLATAGMVALIEPIFDEVLLAGGELPAGLDIVAGDDPEQAPGPLKGLDLKRLTSEGYAAIKTALHIDDTNVMFFAPLLMLVVFMFRGFTNFASAYSFQRIGLGVTTDIRNDVYRRLLEQSSRFHAAHTSGELVSRVVNDVAQMQTAVSARLLDTVQQSVTLLLLVLLLLSTHFQLAVICLLGAPAVVYAIVRFGKGMRRTSHRSQERMAEVTSLLSEGVRGHRVVKAFGMEAFERERFEEATRRHLRVNLRAEMLSTLSSPVVEGIVAIGGAVLLFYSGQKIRAGELTAPLLVQFLANLMLMYDPLRKLNKVNLVLQQALAAAHRLADLLAVPNDIQDRPGARALEQVSEGLRFEGISFAYADVPVLQGFDLEIPRGRTVALVGPSGAGKTTVVNLVPRFFDPDRGRITVDGYDIRDVTLSSLRSLIGIVTQETILFNDTIRNNIAYGRADLPQERVREAAAAAYADDFINELAEGYDTVVGEWGLRLSGGQRQRLAIARALLKNAPILILDEATSQLDSESESLVQKALHNLMQGRTTLVIAHRMSTVKEADSIVVLEAGRVVEQGTHDELMREGGIYKRFVELQFKHEAPVKPG